MEERITATEARAAIHQFLDGLTPRQRDIIARICSGDESQAAVACACGVSAAAISKALAIV